MKRHFTLLFFFFFTQHFLTAQTEVLLDFNQTRLQKTKTAMTILGGWSVVNIGTGLALQGSADGETKYFHQMNALWNGVNLAIALPGYLRARKTNPADFDLAQSMKEQHKFQKILLFNAGLDIGYMIGGAYLMERSKRENDLKKQNQFNGWGKSIVLQGGFLFVFDVVTAWALSKDNPKLEKLFSSVHLGGNSMGLRLVF